MENQYGKQARLSLSSPSCLDRFDNQINNDLPVIQDRNWWVIRERNLLAGDVSFHKNEVCQYYNWSGKSGHFIIGQAKCGYQTLCKF